MTRPTACALSYLEWLRLGFHEAMYTEEDIHQAYAQRQERAQSHRATAAMDWSTQALELALAFVVDMAHDETPIVTRQKDLFIIHLRQALDAANLALSMSEGRSREPPPPLQPLRSVVGRRLTGPPVRDAWTRDDVVDSDEATAMPPLLSRQLSLPHATVAANPAEAKDIPTVDTAPAAPFAVGDEVRHASSLMLATVLEVFPHGEGNNRTPMLRVRPYGRQPSKWPMHDVLHVAHE